MTDPRYANADIHLTGHSMGASLAEWLYGYSLATHGAAETHDRVSATVFACPPWANGVMTHFGLTEADFGNYVQNYDPENDFIQYVGAVQVGVQHKMAAFEPFDLGTDATDALGNFALTQGHHPIAIVLGLGLAGWMSTDQQDAILSYLGHEGDSTGTFNSWDPSYGANGSVSQTITGTSVADQITGSDSADIITGGGGADTLTGGTGADTFVFQVGDSTWSASDRITDFNPVEGDRIDLSHIDAIAGNLWPDDQFSFVGHAPPGQAGQVGFVWVGPDTEVIAHMGGAMPDVVITLSGHVDLNASNFIL